MPLNYFLNLVWNVFRKCTVVVYLLVNTENDSVKDHCKHINFVI